MGGGDHDVCVRKGRTGQACSSAVQLAHPHANPRQGRRAGAGGDKMTARCRSAREQAGRFSAGALGRVHEASPKSRATCAVPPPGLGGSSIRRAHDARKPSRSKPRFSAALVHVGFRRRDSTGASRLHCRGSCRIPHRCSAMPPPSQALPRLGGFVSTGRDCPARVAPMSRREARRPEGPGSRARRAERQSSTARRALRWSRPVFLLTLTVVAGGCATMGCALRSTNAPLGAPLASGVPTHQFAARGVDSKKSSGATLGLFLSDHPYPSLSLPSSINS